MNHLAEHAAELAGLQARALEPDQGEIEAVLARVAARRRSPSHGLLAFVTALSIAITGYGVPATRAAVNDALSAFGTFLAGDENSPGQRLSDEHPPAWLAAARRAGLQAHDSRLIAQRGDERLLVSRNDAGQVCFAFGDASAWCAGTPDDWNAKFRDHQAVALDTEPLTSSQQVALYGAVGPSVGKVTLEKDGRTVATADASGGGFILTVPAGTLPDTLVARSSGGAVLERQDVSTKQWTFCFDEAGCP